MQDIIIEKFREWTAGLSAEEGRIRIFEKIRDIPYVIVPELFNMEDGPKEMLLQNRGFCVPKHYLLGVMYRELKIPVRYCIYPFNWSGQEIDYPPSLREQAEEAPGTYHLVCRASIEDRWILIDATWDPALKKAGFPVNERWDGKSDTGLAIKPSGKAVHESGAEEEDVFKQEIAAYTLPEKLQLARFSIELNKWLDQFREGRQP